jgi:hypothetical protein
VFALLVIEALAPMSVTAWTAGISVRVSGDDTAKDCAAAGNSTPLRE